jgi:hypothetical protein
MKKSKSRNIITNKGLPTFLPISPTPKCTLPKGICNNLSDTLFTLKGIDDYLSNKGLINFRIIEDRPGYIVILLFDDIRQTLTRSEIIDIIKIMKHCHIPVTNCVGVAFAQTLSFDQDDLEKFRKIK